jgi:glycosyltransferase involved in cell wall biosynthesis
VDLLPPRFGIVVQSSLYDRLRCTTRRPWPDQPVRVALVITDLDVGGAERAMTTLATRLDPARWDPCVFCLAGHGRLVKVLQDAEVECVCLRVHRRNPIRAVFRLAHALRRFGPQLVQSFMFHANLTARLAGLLAGRPWVVNGLRVAEHQKRWHLILDSLTAPFATGSVCVSEGVFRFSRDIAGLDPARLTVIPNGVDLIAFDSTQPVSREQIQVPDNAHLALFVGRLDRQKGLEDLLDAAERVIASQPDWHLVLAGDGPRRSWLLAQLVERVSLRERVHWVGYRDDIPGLLKSADAFVLPSLWEGMPNAVLEAMAAGRPVICTSVEGSEELVIPGQTGWMVRRRDAVALSSALIEALNSPQLCRQYGQAGRQRVEEKFSVRSTIEAYERLWAGILGFQLPCTEACNHET